MKCLLPAVIWLVLPSLCLAQDSGAGDLHEYFLASRAADSKNAFKPEIQSTEFGSITIGGTAYRHDVLIRLDGRVEKRKKKLSKQDTGTAHIISLDEARHIYQEGAARLIVGTGQSGMVKLSEQAADFFKGKACAVDLLPTPAAIVVWNQTKGAAIGLFHVTC
jgi:hypothetical protein